MRRRWGCITKWDSTCTRAVSFRSGLTGNRRNRKAETVTESTVLNLRRQDSVVFQIEIKQQPEPPAAVILARPMAVGGTLRNAEIGYADVKYLEPHAGAGNPIRQS